MKHTILIVDDEKIGRESLSKYLSEEYNTCTASNGVEAIKVLSNNEDIELILSDMRMPEMDGLKLLDEVTALPRELVLVFMTAFSTIESAVSAMRKGAYDYLTKPIDLTKLDITIKNALETKRLKHEVIFLKEKIRQQFDTKQLVGDSVKIKENLELVKRVSSTKATVLIQGDSGTGKELVANIIHYNSPVSDGPFIKVNCAALSEGLLESELFGHEKGSFTGALFSKKGRFELAHGGTLFLDEIGELPPIIQVKLLRVLQESEFERVGGTKTIKVNVRIISATNKNLDESVKKELFREDLFYRLKVVTIEVPSLRERTGDIVLIARHYLNKFNELHNKKIVDINPDVMELLKQYSWPGNIRELTNCIESAVVMSHGDFIDMESLPPYLIRKMEENADITPETVDSVPEQDSLNISNGPNSTGNLFEIERKAISEALNSANGNKGKAANLLGIGLRTLYRKLAHYGIKE